MTLQKTFIFIIAFTCISFLGNAQSALLQAVKDNNLTNVRFLHNQGAKLNVQDGELKITPLMVAVEQLHVEIVSFLLEKGADPNITDANKKAPLHYVFSAFDKAVREGDQEKALKKEKKTFQIVKLLLDYGANPNTELVGPSPLHLAAWLGLPKVGQILLEHGADINAQDNRLNTPLHYALYYQLKFKKNDYTQLIRSFYNHAVLPSQIPNMQAKIPNQIRSDNQRPEVLSIQSITPEKSKAIVRSNFDKGKFYPINLEIEVKDDYGVLSVQVNHSIAKEVRPNVYHASVLVPWETQHVTIDVMDVFSKKHSIQHQTSLTKNRKLALVIGVKDYEIISSLKNTLNDADSIANSLSNMGFDVIRVSNGVKSTIEEKIQEFTERMKYYNVTLFYYSGHGVQEKGVNYLIPKEATMSSHEKILEECVSINQVMKGMKSANNKLNILIMDACRESISNMALTRTSTYQYGLQPVEAPNGSIILYATAPGELSGDGSGNNGIFTASLLKFIKHDISIGTMFDKVCQDVVKKTQGKQTPWITKSFFEEFKLNVAM
ncbi:caspase family protein [Algivirga pacifica]